jgi:isoleucyl-tRNA synthetase
VQDAGLAPLERLILGRAATLAATSRDAYARFEFHAVVRGLLDFATVDLSAFWCDARKDAFYCLAETDGARRSAQTAAYRLTETIALLLQPICPFTAEEIWESLPGRAGTTPALETLDSLRLPGLSPKAAAAWERILSLRAEFQKRLEPLRREGKAPTSAQAMARITPNEALEKDLATVGLGLDGLAEVLIVPEVDLVPGLTPTELYGGLGLDVHPAEGTKCPRCWRTLRAGAEDGLCGRCGRVLEALRDLAE